MASATYSRDLRSVQVPSQGEGPSAHGASQQCGGCSSQHAGSSSSRAADALRGTAQPRLFLHQPAEPGRGGSSAGLRLLDAELHWLHIPSFEVQGLLRFCFWLLSTGDGDAEVVASCGPAISNKLGHLLNPAALAY